MGPLMGQAQRGRPVRWGDGVSPAEEGGFLGDFKPAVAQPASLWPLRSPWLNSTGLATRGRLWSVRTVSLALGGGRVAGASTVRRGDLCCGAQSWKGP